jgi:GNAT superfamily N-acetyltransferase
LSILRIVLRITAFEPVYRDGVARICAAEGWTSWTAENVLAAFSAPSVIAITALEGDEISGVAQLLTDGRVMAYLGLLIVDRHARGQGIGRALRRRIVFALRAGPERLALRRRVDSLLRVAAPQSETWLSPLQRLR